MTVLKILWDRTAIQSNGQVIKQGQLLYHLASHGLQSIIWHHMVCRVSFGITWFAEYHLASQWFCRVSFCITWFAEYHLASHGLQSTIWHHNGLQSIIWHHIGFEEYHLASHGLQSIIWYHKVCRQNHLALHGLQNTIWFYMVCRIPLDITWFATRHKKINTITRLQMHKLQ